MTDRRRIAVVRASRRAPRALLSMRYFVDGIKESPHPEEAAKRPSRRTHGTHARRILGSAAEGRLVGSVDPDGGAEGLAD
jgi:hypothetical protein